jgi:hypothetical protein
MSVFVVVTPDHFDRAVAMAHYRVAHGAGQEMAMMMVPVRPNHYEICVPRSGLFHNRDLWMSGYHFFRRRDASLAQQLPNGQHCRFRSLILMHDVLSNFGLAEDRLGRTDVNVGNA